MYRYLYIAISIFFNCYVVAYAAIVPFTVDEAWTYIEFVKQSTIWQVVNYDHPVANNHIFNSVLTRFFAWISQSEVSLRMPNIIGFLLYLYASYRISKDLVRSELMQLCLFLALLLNMGMIQFFGLCRGYGLGIGLLMFSLHFLTSDTISHRNRSYSLLFALLATWASFVLLYAFMGILCYIVFINIYDARAKLNLKALLKIIALPATCVLLLWALCIRPLILAIKWEQLYFGGTDNFYTDSVVTFTKMLAGYELAGRYNSIAIIVATTGAFALVVNIYGVINSKLKRGALVIPLLFLWCLACINGAFYIQDVKLPVYRTALYLYPLFVVSLFTALRMMEQSRAIHVTSMMVSGCLLFLFINQKHFVTPEEWWFENDNKRVLQFIKARERSNKKISIAVSHQHSYNSFSYYSISEFKPLIDTVIGLLPGQPMPDMEHIDYLYLPRELSLPAHSRGIPLRTFCDGKYQLYLNR